MSAMTGPMLSASAPAFSAATHPSAPMIVLQPVHGWPRSTPVRSAHATAIRLPRAVPIAITTSPGRSPSGRSISGQLVGTSNSCVPASATIRVSSGNSTS